MNGCKIKGELAPETIPVVQMKDGQLAVVTAHPGDYVGAVVQRCGDSVFYLGKPSCGGSFPVAMYSTSIRVRPLKAGETILV